MSSPSADESALRDVRAGFMAASATQDAARIAGAIAQFDELRRHFGDAAAVPPRGVRVGGILVSHESGGPAERG